MTLPSCSSFDPKMTGRADSTDRGAVFLYAEIFLDCRPCEPLSVNPSRASINVGARPALRSASIDGDAPRRESSELAREPVRPRTKLDARAARGMRERECRRVQ